MTQPHNGQYPRPWMTKTCDPLHARVFIVGKNQAKAYPVDKVGNHDRHIDAVFNRNGESCDALYDFICEGKPSKSRPIIRSLSSCLAQRGIHDVLETNVVCYSTPMSRHLAKAVHAGGVKKGEEIFHTLLSTIQPLVLIVHGQGTTTSLSGSLDILLPAPPLTPDKVVCTRIYLGDYSPLVVVIPSLAMPAAAIWSGWRSEHLALVADQVAAELERT